jgi:Arc/MetJ-type ribon-helix-helix transcriptional regulator
MTRYEKITISLPSYAAERVRRAVKNGEAPSASAYIVNAIGAKMSREETIAMLDEWLEESGGPMTPAEKRRIDRELNTPVNYGPLVPARRPGRRKKRR